MRHWSRGQTAAVMEDTRSSWHSDINVPQSQASGRLGDHALNLDWLFVNAVPT